MNSFDDFVLYVSSFNARKNHQFLISIWKEVRSRLKNSRRRPVPGLVLAGMAQKGFEQFCDEKYKAELATDGIFVLNNLSDAEIGGLYQHCLFTVYPSRSEGWGFPPIESLLAGKLCVVSNNVPSARETKCSGLIHLNPYQAEAWIKVLMAFIDRPQMREAFENAINLETIPRWEDTYHSIIAE